MTNRGFAIESLLSLAARIVLPGFFLLVIAAPGEARESQDDQNMHREASEASTKKVEWYLDDGSDYESNMEVGDSKSTRPNAEYIDLRGPASKASIGY